MPADNGIRLKAYTGDRSTLLAFDLDKDLTPNLAGFAIRCTMPGGEPYFLYNRLSFDTDITNATTPEQRTWTHSDQAPFQKFRWVHFPANLAPGDYCYEVFAMYRKPDGSLQQGPSKSVSIELVPANPPCPKFEIAFTRGYLSSQAYATKFKNAPVRPLPKNIDYDTGPYENRYAWLGGHGREMIFRFLNEAIADPSISLDVFAFDLDEPDIIRGLVKLGNRLRILMDDSDGHTKATALEPKAESQLIGSAGKDNVQTGHFGRFSHSKVMIQKKDGQPIKVLAGSANFSVRGLYVQANNVFVYDDQATAALYEQVFQQAFIDMRHFRQADVSKKWFELTGDGIPQSRACFSPHSTASVSLGDVVTAIRGAKSSVLFAVMELGGTGDVLKELREMSSKPGIFSYGVTQHLSGDLAVYTPGRTGVLVPFAFLKEKVPQPFRPEYDGGTGQVIHHKFVVVDFNGDNPVVFAGSSNLAAGGEEDNGDNLVAIYEPSVVTAYAVEAIRLVDHYVFRAAWEGATQDSPLTLTYDPMKPWWAKYYDPADIHCREREVLIG